MLENTFSTDYGISASTSTKPDFTPLERYYFHLVWRQFTSSPGYCMTVHTFVLITILPQIQWLTSHYYYYRVLILDNSVYNDVWQLIEYCPPRTGQYSQFYTVRSVCLVFNGTSTQEGQFVPTAGESKSAWAVKDGQRCAMYNTLYTTQVCNTIIPTSDKTEITGYLIVWLIYLHITLDHSTSPSQITHTLYSV